MNNVESENKNNALSEGMRSMNIKENTMPETLPAKRESRTTVVLRDYPIVVSEKQFETVVTEHKASLDLLNSSANVLLGAMKGMVPPEGSGRVVGEYTGQGMRQLAKSICDIIQTKSGVIRTMYQISRDET